MNSAGGHQYETATWWHKLVAEYTGLNILQVEELELVKYLTFQRDAFIYKLNQTETGREYLDNAWRCEQTEPDRAALRAKYGRKEAQ